MDIYTIIAEPTGSPMYVVGTYRTQEIAKDEIKNYFGNICKKIDTLPGSCLACIAQYIVFNTVVSICLTELK